MEMNSRVLATVGVVAAGAVALASPGMTTRGSLALAAGAAAIVSTLTLLRDTETDDEYKDGSVTTGSTQASGRKRNWTKAEATSTSTVLVRDDEAKLSKDNQVLLRLVGHQSKASLDNFFGIIVDISEADAAVSVSTSPDSKSMPNLEGKTVFVCGDLASTDTITVTSGTEKCTLANCLGSADSVKVVEEFSRGKLELPNAHEIQLGQVPLDVHGVGVLYPRFFDTREQYFNRITNEHEFQSLTESNKPGTAHRTGIYMTPVVQRGDNLHFRVLRCSSNLSGPTLNFRETDTHVVDALNLEAEHLFEGPAPLNHVLAQIYHNTPASNGEKQRKAKIKAHADKTKDMPENGIMAFCTFYDQLEKLSPNCNGDPWDYGQNNVSGLTRLHFRLKACVAKRRDSGLAEQFSVTLYPNSVFFMSLSTNRLYTHEIRPGALSVEDLPTRMGYVVRCSSTDAVFLKRQGRVHIKKQDGQYARLATATPEGMSDLRQMYAEENLTDNFVDYADRFMFSMNKGDYRAPRYAPADEFRVYPLTISENPFEDLLASVHFEPVHKGRQGAILVRPDETRGIPIVRTTTKYEAPAQQFQATHARLADQIKDIASLRFSLNNAMAELYTNKYFKMGFHSDQALDLEDGSAVAIFSCYSNPEVAKTNPRLLIIEPKEGDGERFEIPLAHNTVVVFNMDTNKRFRHKIVLDMSERGVPENEWFGMTFRTSKTFVTVPESKGPACFEDGIPLTMATDKERRDFYKLRSRENKETDFTYPPLTYTISKSDSMLPVTK